MKYKNLNTKLYVCALIGLLEKGMAIWGQKTNDTEM